MYQIKVGEKIKTQTLCSMMFSENHATYEMTWRNIVEQCILQMTIWRMRITCWISKTTNTLSDYVTLNAFSTATMVARTCLSVKLYVHCCLFKVVSVLSA